ncbi:MAG TPA: hypothetical protein VK191_12755 [Symbiobacteriaceae bacterium]|nr:hypothetical protein [Symbiobacteriaceae bacterium]
MARRVTVFDTTLRDGEQSPGFGLTAEQKLEVVRQLARLGVDVIEAGYPGGSPSHLAAVKRIAETIEGPQIAALARANRAEIDAVYAALGGAKRQGRIHIVLGTSPIQMAQDQKRPHEVVTMAREAIAYARSLGLQVQFSAKDATRSEPSFLTQIFTVAVRAGATILNVPDTLGYATAKEYHDLMHHLIEHVDAPEGLVTFSAHCHNDLGQAVGNTLAGLEAGALQFESTINGIGERAGNAALEEVVMALETRKDRWQIETGIKTQELYRTSRLVQSLTGLAVQPNKAVVGANILARESGINLDHDETYDDMLSAEPAPNWQMRAWGD